MIFATLGTHWKPMPRLVAALEAVAAENPELGPFIIQRGETPLPRGWSGEAFMRPAELRDRLAAADIVICHAGPATIALARSLGRIPIVVPRERRRGEHVDDHQRSFARHLGRANEVIVVEDADDLSEAVSRQRSGRSSLPRPLAVDRGPAVSRFARLAAEVTGDHAPRRLAAALSVMALAAATGPFVRLIGDASEPDYIPVRLAALGLGGLAVLAAGVTPVVRSLLSPPLLALLAWSALSLLWTDSTADTLQSGAGLASAVIVGATLASSMHASRVASAVAAVFSLLSAVSLALGAFAPAFGTTPVVRPEGVATMNTGLFAWNSDLGVVAGVGAVLCYALAASGRGRVWALLAALNVAVLVWSDSVTMILAALVAIAGVVAVRRRWSVALAGLAVVAFVAVGQFAAQPGTDPERPAPGAGTSEPRANLSGRTGIWAQSIRLVAEEPLLGRGLGAGGAELRTDDGTPLGHVHNGYLQVALDLGVVGLAIVAVLIGRTAMGIVARARDALSSVAMLSVFLFQFVANGANTYLLTAHALSAVLFWLYLGAGAASTEA